MVSNCDWRLALCVGMLLGAVGCGESSESTDAASLPEGTWAARVPDADAWLAVTVEGDHAAAFVCGNEDRLELSRWMSAPAADAMAFELEGVKLSVDLSDDEMSGSLVDPDGAEVTVVAPRVDGQGIAGLYTAMDAGARDGLILLPGEANDALGAWRDTLGNLSQVTPVKPVELTDLGLLVEADTAVGVRAFAMKPVVPREVSQ